MSRRSLSRSLAVATTAAALSVVAAPVPALAGDMFFAKSSGTVATASWLEVGVLPPEANAPGNAHFGDLFVEDLGNGRASVFGTVYDVECDGEVYNPGGGHGAPDPEGSCRLLGMRFIEGGTVQFTVDRKLSSATLTGTLAVGSGHGEGPVGAPPVAITWTATGSSYSTRESGSYTDEYATWSYRYAFTGRDAEVASGSRIGPMVFDDEAGESSTAQLGKYRSSDRSRS